MEVLDESDVRAMVKKYFTVDELVDKLTVQKYGQRAWRFMDYRLLYSLLLIRHNLDKPIIVNTSRLQQRGLRTILQPMVQDHASKGNLYLSPHLMGKAVDFDVKGMTAEEVRAWIVENERIFPFKIRLEDNVSWVHLDVVYEEHNDKVHLFTP